MKILVTGGSGLVGSALKHVPTEHTLIFPTSSECNLLDYNAVLECLNKHKPDYIIHLAANVGGLYKNIFNKTEMLENNLMMNYNILKACYASQIKNCICMLSTCIFPNETSYPINESMLHSGPPHPSNEGYAYAKRMMEIQCRLYNDQYGTNYQCIIPTNIYGFDDNYSLTYGHVIPSLIHKCYLSKMSDAPFVVCGSGRPLRQFLYSEDLARAILQFIDFPKDHKCVIVSPSEEISIKDIALKIAECFEFDGQIVFDTSMSDGQFKKTADNSLFRSLYPDFKFSNFDEKIINVVEHFKQNYITVRK